MTSRIDSDLPLQRRNTLWIEEYLTRLGDRVRAARARRGMSRRILARDSGVSERYLAQLESGRGNPSVAVLHQVANAMDMSMMELADPHADSDPALSEIQALLAPLAPAELSEAAEILARHFADSGTRGRRISLIGLRGAGKTTLGKALADTLGFPFLELNREIEKDYGASIGELLSLSGQPAFRRYENRCLNGVLNAYDEAVIATGGGIVANADTFAMLLRRSHTIWLRASPEEHMKRVIEQGDMRPMAQNREAMSDLRAILDSRTPLYNRADTQVDTSGCDPQTSLAILTETARDILA